MDKKVLISQTVDQTVQAELDPLLTAEEVAPIIRVKPQTIRDAAWRKKIPCVRLWSGKRKTLLRFKKSEIEDFIRKKSIPAKNR